MKNIVCLIDGLNQGGAERQLIGLTKLLQDRQYNSTLVSYGDDIFYLPLVEENHLDFVFIQNNGGRLSKIWQVYRLLRKVKPCVIISYKDGPNMMGCILKLLGLKYKLIVSERNTTQNLSPRTKIKLFLYRLADYIVPNSFSQEKFLISYDKNLCSKIKTITNYTDLSKYTPTDIDHRDMNEVLVAAKIAPQKNVVEFLRAIKIIKEEGCRIHVSWFGNVVKGYEDYWENIKEQISSLNIQDCIEFHHATKNLELEYNKVGVFCLPSIYEGYPNVVCEAMACGLPILCSDVCDNPRIVEDGINGYLFNPRDANSMANIIMDFLHLSEDGKKQMGKKSREIAERKFSSSKFVDDYIKLIEG